MNKIWNNPGAFAPMLEDVLWEEDAAPHRRGTIRAAVFQGASQSPSAGPSLDGIPADPWTLQVPISTALAVNIKMGDSITLAPHRGGAVLSVQQITRTAMWYIIIATAEERAPLP